MAATITSKGLQYLERFSTRKFYNLVDEFWDGFFFDGHVAQIRIGFVSIYLADNRLGTFKIYENLISLRRHPGNIFDKPTTYDGAIADIAPMEKPGTLQNLNWGKVANERN